MATDLTIKQIYDANPSTTLGDNDLLYAGLSPYGLTNDSAIKIADFLSNLTQDIVTTGVLSASLGVNSSPNSLSELGANATPSAGFPHAGQFIFHIDQSSPNDLLVGYKTGSTTKTFSINNVDQRLGGTILSAVTIQDPTGSGSVIGTSTGMLNILGNAPDGSTPGVFGKIAISNARNRNEAAWFGAYNGGGGQAWLAMGLRNSGTDDILMIMDPDGDIAFASPVYTTGLFLSADPFSTLKTGTPHPWLLEPQNTFAQFTSALVYDPGQSQVTIPQLLNNNLGIPVVTAPGLLTPLTLTNGQLIIGSTGANSVAANLTSADGSVTITNGAGSINLKVVGASATNPSFLAFLASTANNKTGNGTAYTLGTDALTKVFDNGTNLDANGGVFTAPATGIYTFGTCITITGCTIATTFTVTIGTTTRTYSKKFTRTAIAGDMAMDLVVTDADMTIGDVAVTSITVTGEAADTDDILGSSTLVTFWSGHRVR